MAVLLAGTFVATLDFFIVAVAVPSLQADLGATAAGVQGVLTGFALAYGSVLIIGGRLGDIFGRRRLYMLGIALFTGSSVVCGVAPTSTVLVIGRIAQGLSAGLLSPQVLSTLGTTYPTGVARARVFTAYGVVMGLAAVLGQILGGLLIEWDVAGLGWRTCFLINVPIGLAVLALTPRLVPESRAPQGRRLDLVGMVLIALALTAVVLPLVEGREQGWPPWVWLCLAAAAVLFAGFALFERRLEAAGGQPLVDLAMFRERAFTAGLLAQIVFFMAMAAFFLVFALYVQNGRGLNALQAGLLFTATGVGYMTTSLTARFVAARLGRQCIALGAGLRVAGSLLMILVVSLIGTGGSAWWLVPGMIVDAAGMGIAIAPLAGTVLSRMTPEYAGAAAGVLNTGLQVGNALGVALVGVVFFGVGGDGTDVAGAFIAGMSYVVAVAVVLALIVQFLPRHPAST